jgi:hypothetical protein
MLVVSEQTAELITVFCETWNNKDFESIDQIRDDLSEIVQQLLNAPEYVVISKNSVDES